MGYAIFSPSALAGAVRAGDSRRYKVDLKGQRKTLIASASENALSSAVCLATFNKTKLRGRDYVSYADFERALVLRCVAKHLRRRLNIRMPNRHGPVRGIIESMLDSTPMSVVRCDIESFYESVCVAPIRDRLVYDTASSSVVRSYLSSFFDTHCAGKGDGVPRGTGLSAVLAELAMRDFDAAVKQIAGVYRYFRYADDIIAFTTGDPDDVLRQIRECLPSSMRLNKAKSYVRRYDKPKESGSNDPQQVSFEYLGYKFSTTPYFGQTSSRSVKVSIADKKIRKLKSRVILSLHDFRRNADDRLLLDRIRFLTSNYRVRRSGQTHISRSRYIRSGIFYNYCHCGVYRVGRRWEQTRLEHDGIELKSLDGFLRSLLRSKSSEFRGIIAAGVSPQRRAELFGLSFYQGFSRRMNARLTPERVSEIKRAWRHG